MALFEDNHVDDRTQLLRIAAGVEESTLPGIEVVGAGYDPFSGYANSSHIVSSIFDWSAADKDTFTYLGRTYTKPGVINAYDASNATTKIVTGKDIQTFQQNLAVSADVEGSAGFFSGSLETEFSSQSLTKSESAFSRIQQNISTWSLQLTIEPETRDLLKTSFKNRLDTLDPQDEESLRDFFTRYGSHILTGVVIGGRALRASSTNRYTVDQSYSLGVTAQEAFKSASGQASASEKLKYADAVSSFETNSETTETVTGGNPTLGSTVFADNSTFPGWRDSVITSPIFIDFGKQNPLTPIWELREDSVAGKRIEAALRSYFKNTWAPRRAEELRKRPDYVDKVAIVTSDDSNVLPPTGYTKVPQDLNASVGGKFIYLCQHKEAFSPARGTSNKDAIISIDVIYGQNTPVPEGYVKISSDLNEGAGGEYIYLCYRPGTYDENTALLDITAFAGNSPEVTAPYGYVKLDKDLNAGSGGSYIYFGYSNRGSS